VKQILCIKLVKYWDKFKFEACCSLDCYTVPFGRLVPYRYSTYKKAVNIHGHSISSPASCMCSEESRFRCFLVIVQDRQNRICISSSSGPGREPWIVVFIVTAWPRWSMSSSIDSCGRIQMAYKGRLTLESYIIVQCRFYGHRVRDFHLSWSPIVVPISFPANRDETAWPAGESASRTPQATAHISLQLSQAVLH